MAVALRKDGALTFEASDLFEGAACEAGAAATKPSCPADDVAEERSIDPARRETVVLVEDDAAVRQVAAMILDLLGYRVVEFSSAAPALGYLSTGPSVALLFTDIRLPGDMCGTDLALEVRRLRPDLPILLTTGNVSDVAPHVLRRLPGTEILLKPYGRSRLQRLVTASLVRGRASQ